MPYDFHSRLDRLGGRFNNLAGVKVKITRDGVTSPEKDAHRTSIRMEEAGDEGVITLTRHTAFMFEASDYDLGDGNGAIEPDYGDTIYDCVTGFTHRVVAGLDAMKMSNDIPPRRYLTGTNKRVQVMTVRIG